MFGQYGFSILLVFATIAVTSTLIAMGKAPNGGGMVSLYFAGISSVLTGMMQRFQNAALPVGIGVPIAILIIVAGVCGLFAAYFKLARDSHDVAGAWIGAICVVLMSQGTSMLF